MSGLDGNLLFLVCKKKYSYNIIKCVKGARKPAVWRPQAILYYKLLHCILYYNMVIKNYATNQYTVYILLLKRAVHTKYHSNILI